MSVVKDSNISMIYIPLLEEGTSVFRPTKGICLYDNVYEVLPTSDYDPEDETWKFPPGRIVRCRPEDHDGEMILVAKELI